jgi:hypothetical protein
MDGWNMSGCVGGGLLTRIYIFIPAIAAAFIDCELHAFTIW